MNVISKSVLHGTEMWEKWQVMYLNGCAGAEDTKVPEQRLGHNKNLTMFVPQVGVKPTHPFGQWI